MPARIRRYSRPNAHADKVYPVALCETDSERKSVVTKTKTIGISFSSGEAAKLAVALMNGVSMISKEHMLVDLTLRIYDKAVTVTVA